MIEVITQQFVQKVAHGKHELVEVTSFVDPRQIRRVGEYRTQRDKSIGDPHKPSIVEVCTFIEWLNGEGLDVFESKEAIIKKMTGRTA